MKEKLAPKIFGKPEPKPWKPRSLPAKSTQPQLPKPVSPKAFIPAHTDGDYRREVFEPIISGPIELGMFATEVAFRLRDADGEREIKSCYGDIYKVINALMDYARILEQSCDEWGLQGYHRAVYELYAKDFRIIAKKYQEAIGYDYDAAVARCKAKRNRAHKDDNIGGDALEMTVKHGSQSLKKKG